MNDCPSIAELDAHASGDGSVLVQTHLSACPTCQARLDDIRRNNDEMQSLVGTVAAHPELRRSDAPRFPGYQVQRELSRGGQGVVYQALQTSTRRIVAIKELHGGPIASDRRRRRFEREVELASRLRHPHIVTVFDSGVTEDGRPYFVMEFIEGKPLQEHLAGLRAAEPSTATDRILTLVAQVCDAVNHAHRHGVIHRDLKPNNILVDAEGGPHILDFGLAKDTVSVEDAATITHAGEFMGTLAFASPEQVAGNPDAVDVRSDVYTLGVIAHEGLTGRLPYGDCETVRELIDAIAERDADVSQLPRHSSDLEAVILRALAREPDRRYQSAGDLARDLENVASRRPVEALRDSPWYVVRKTLQRHRAPVAVALGVAVLLVAAFLVSVAGWREASIEGQNARIAAGEARALNQFLMEMFEGLDPDLARGRDVSVRDMLDLAVRHLRDDPPSDPQVEETVRQVVGRAYQQLGHLTEALHHLQTAVDLSEGFRDRDPRSYTDNLFLLSSCLTALGDHDAAEKELDRIREWSRSTPSGSGSGGPRVRPALDGQVKVLRATIAAERGDLPAAEALVQEGLEKMRQGASTQSRLYGLAVFDHAMMLADNNHRVAAESRFAESLRIMEAAGLSETLAVSSILRERARNAAYLPDPELVEQLSDQAASLATRLLGDPLHPTVVISRSHAARSRLTRGVAVPAQELAELRAAARDMPVGRSNVFADAWNNTGILAEIRGDRSEARTAYLKSLECYDQLPGEFVLDRVIVQGNLILVLLDLGETDDAERRTRQSIEAYRSMRPKQRVPSLVRMSDLCFRWTLLGRMDLAEELIELALTTARSHAADDDRVLGPVLSAHGWLLAKTGEEDAGEEELRGALERIRGAFAEQEDPLLYCMHRLAGVLMTREPSESEELFYELLDLYEPLPQHRRALSLVHSDLAVLQARDQRLDDAADHLEEALRILEGPPRAADVERLSALLNFAFVCRELGRHDESLERYEESLRIARRFPPRDERRVAAVQGLSQLYHDLDQPERAAELLATEAAAGD